MPKSNHKRKRKLSDTDASVIGGKDLQKLQKLVKLNAEENDDGDSRVGFKKPVPPAPVTIADANDDDIESYDQLSLKDCLTEMPPEFGEDWNKFFCQPHASQEFAENLQKNISEAKLKVDDALSDFTGSWSGSELGGGGDLAGIDGAGQELPPELLSHLRLVSDVLTRYRSGRLPKTVKVLPNLPGYDGLLELLRPLEWTPHVYPRVVRVFAAKGNDPALHFYSNYLLPRVRADIEANRRLSVQLFEALIRSMFRPEEFVAGLFLPWMQSEMSKTEGVILANLVKKASLKARYAAVGLVLALDEEFSIPRSLVIESLLSKRYHLPSAALARVAHYFLSFDKDCHTYFTTEQRMPVTWFKTLLQFLESYHKAIKPDQRDAFVKLCQRHQHPQISPELRSLLALIPSTSSSYSE